MSLRFLSISWCVFGIISTLFGDDTLMAGILMLGAVILWVGAELQDEIRNRQ